MAPYEILEKVTSAKYASWQHWKFELARILIFAKIVHLTYFGFDHVNVCCFLSNYIDLRIKKLAEK